MDISSIKKVLKIESYDFKVVSDLCGVVNHDADKETQLVDLLAAYFESVGKTSDLLQWAIQWEVAKTDSPNALFRLESVATALMFRIFFTEEGMYCLQTTVTPLIDRVIAETKKGDSKELGQDVDFILNQTQKFLGELEQATAFFPVELREGFVALAKEVSKKFPKTKNAVSVLLFLRFLCPSILQAHAFGVIKDPLPAAAVPPLLSVAKLLQCIANEQVENKITMTGIGKEKIEEFIKEHIAPIRAYTARLVNENEVFVMKKMVATKKSNSSEEKTIEESNLKAIIDYITSTEFPLPSLVIDEKARQLPTLLKKKKLGTLNGSTVLFQDVLDTIKINLIFLFPDLNHPSYITIMDETSKIRLDLEKLGVKQALITGGTLEAAIEFNDNTSFKGDIFIDAGSKMQQLFALRARKDTSRSLLTHKMNAIRKSDAPASQLLAHRTPEKAIKHDKEKNKEKDKSEKHEKNEKEKKVDKTDPKDTADVAKPVKLYITVGDHISFEKTSYTASPEDLVNVLQVCGAKQDVIQGWRVKLKKKRKKTWFQTLKRSNSTFQL